MNAQVWMGILLPFLGTSLGAAMVFVLKDRISDGIQRMLTGFAAGVMVAASFWSLLQPALDGAEHMGGLVLPSRRCGIPGRHWFFAAARQRDAAHAHG